MRRRLSPCSPLLPGLLSAAMELEALETETWIISTGINYKYNCNMFTALAFATAAYGVSRVARYFL